MQTPASDPKTDRGPLEGIRIIAFTHFLFGPACAQYLADLGADVIKVEEPRVGAWERNWAGGETFVGGLSAFFALTHRNVRSLGVNLKCEQGLRIAQKLIEDADVLIENFRPGVMESLSLGYDELHGLNSKLIYASGSGYGTDPRYRDLPGQDLLIQAVSGIAAVTGPAGMPPIPSGVPVVDQHAAALLAMGIVAALHGRSHTGEGEHVELSMVSAALDLQQEPLAYFMNGGLVSRPQTNIGSAFHEAPYGIYVTSDGHIALSLSPIARLAQALDSPEELEPFLDQTIAFEQRDAIHEALSPLLLARSTHDLVAAFRALEVWCSPVNDYDSLMHDPIINSLSPFVEVLDPDVGRINLVGPPLRFGTHAARKSEPPPRLGQHTDEILAGLGYSSDETAKLRAQKVI